MAYSYEEFDKIFDQLDSVLSDTNFDDVTAESTGYDEIPDGYYLCEVTSSEIKASKTSGLPMAAFQLTIVENGMSVEQNESGAITMNEITRTKGRKLFRNYVLKDSASVKRFAADMLKFEKNGDGIPYLPKEAFMNHETLEDALSVLIGMRIYTQQSTSTKMVDGKEVESKWVNLISWKRAKQLELPM